MGTTFLHNTFFPLIRAGLGLVPDKAAMPADIDYARLMEIAQKQAVLPLIREGLATLQLHGEGPDAVQERCMNDIYLFVHRDEALGAIKRCFEKNGIDYVLLKGAVLRDLYPEQWMRTSCDIDVLVREEAVESAVDALRRETDFQVLNRSYHDVAMAVPNVHLELHFNIKEDMEAIDGLLSTAWEHATRQGETHQYVFSPEFQVFHVVAHMAYHFVHGGLGVRPYLDLWLLRHKTTYDETAVQAMCEQCGLSMFYEKCGALGAVWLEGAAHDAVTAALEQYSIGGGVFGSRKNITLAIQRRHRGGRYYLSRLFMDRRRLEVRYPRLKQHPGLLPFYQGKRWVDAVLHRQASVKNEIAILKHTKQQEIQSLNELFDSVGL